MHKDSLLRGARLLRPARALASLSLLDQLVHSPTAIELLSLGYFYISHPWDILTSSARAVHASAVLVGDIIAWSVAALVNVLHSLQQLIERKHMPVATIARHGEVLLLIAHGMIFGQSEGSTRRSARVHLIAREGVLAGRAAHKAVLLSDRARHGLIQLGDVRRGRLRGGLRLHAVDADDPVLGGEGLLEVLQPDVLVLAVTCTTRAYAHHRTAVEIVAGGLRVAEPYLTEAVVGETVHETVAHGRRRVLVDAVLHVM